MTARLAVFASGAGSNAQKIIDHFKKSPQIEVALVVCNNPQAGVLAIAQQEQIETLLIDKQLFTKGDAYLPLLKEKNIQFLILAGFLWKIPDTLVKAYPQKIINIHPALLPKYGGKGMYGQWVHQAVIAAGDAKSGITIHYVDEIYDHGAIIFQATCDVNPQDTPETLAQKIHTLEHRYFPQIIEKVVLDHAPQE